jgi:tape measure domain-containing protein
MSIDAESLAVAVGADTTSADETIAQFSARTAEQLATIETKIDGLGGGGSGGGSGGKVDDFFGKFLTFQAVVQAGRAVEGFVQSAVSAYAENERLGLSLDTLVARELRNKDATLSMADALDQASPKAQELLKWNEQLAVNSPFNEAGIASAFRTAEAFGFVSESADKTAITAKRLTQDLVDFTAGSGQSEEVLNRITAALGKVEVSGQLSGREVRELTLAGVQVDAVLAKAFGKSTEEIVKLREQGLIPGDQAIKAIAYSLENDFGGAAQRQAGTVSGLLNSLSDLETIGSRELFSGAIQAAQPYLQQFVDTLNSPEAQATIKAISDDLGVVVKEELPQIITQAQEWYAVGVEIYGVVKPIVDAYHELQNIKIPGLGGEVGDVLGSGAITKFMTGGYLLDLGHQLQGLSEQYGLITPAASAANAAMSSGGGGSWGATIQEQQQLALSTQASAEELKKYQGELDKTGETGQAAYEKLADSQAQFQEAEQNRLSDHQARLASIEQSAREQHATAAENYRQADADRQQSYQERQKSLITTALRQQTDAEATEHDRQVAASEQQQTKIDDMRARGLERWTENQQQQAQRAEDYQAQIVSAVADAAQKLGDIQTREHDRQTQAEQSYQDRVASLVQRGADLQTQASEASAERQAQASEASAERQAQAVERLADRQQQYAEKVADLTANAADTQQTNEEQFQEDKQTRASDHADRLSDLQDQLHAATDAKQKAAIQKQIEAENERYDKQEAKAQTSYDRQAEKAAKALERQLEQAEQAEARQEEQDARALAKQDAQAEKQLAKQDAQAEKQLTKQQEQLAKEQAAQDKAYADTEAKAKSSYDRQTLAQETASAAQLAKLQDTYTKQAQAGEAKFQTDFAGLQKAFYAEIDSYNASEAKQAQHLATQRDQKAAALSQQLEDAQTSFDLTEQKASLSFDRQQKAADTARGKQIANEDASFARAERSAQASYEKQQASLDASLGKQLLAYTDTQLKMSAITAQEADKRHALIAKEFGVDPQAAQGQFAAYLAQLSNGGVAPYVGGAGERGAGLSIGSVTIQLPSGVNVNDPNALAAATQAALLQLANRNGGTGITP